MEIWKTTNINNLSSYEVSNLGRVRNIKTGKILKLCNGPHKHLFFRVTVNKIKANYSVHRLVIIAFMRELKPNEVVNHINNIPYDNRLENLEITTIVQNMNRTIKNKKRPLKIKELFNSKEWSSAKEFYDTIMKDLY